MMPDGPDDVPDPQKDYGGQRIGPGTIRGVY